MTANVNDELSAYTFAEHAVDQRKANNRTRANIVWNTALENVNLIAAIFVYKYYFNSILVAGQTLY